MKLRVFVVDAYSSKSDVLKTVESFKGRVDDFQFVDSLFEINFTDKYEEGWFGVIYNNEKITEELVEALPKFFEFTEADVLVAYKRENKEEPKVSRSPRFFRGDIPLSIECLMPEDETLDHQIMLDGWIEEQ